MAEYYLISQLPSLDSVSDSAPLPITEERFLELCSRFLDKKTMRELKQITLVPKSDYEEIGSNLIDSFCKSERDLRLALVKARAEKMKKPCDVGSRNLPIVQVKAANAAVEIENPMEAEKFLARHRLEVLEDLRPIDGFSRDFIFYYAIKLKLILRIRQFDTESGQVAYKNIYDTILNSDRAEVTQ